MESRHIRILNNMASVGGSVDSVISTTLCLLFLFARTISWFFGRKKSVNKYSVSPKMPRSGAQSQVLRAPSIFMDSVYDTQSGMTTK